MFASLYRRLVGASYEEVFYIKLPRDITVSEFVPLHWLLNEPGYETKTTPFLEEGTFVEVGPRLSVETPFSSNAVAVFRSVGLPVERIEKSFRYAPGQEHIDHMTQEIYATPLSTFDSGRLPEPVSYIDILGRGEDALREANKVLGLGMDDWDLAYWTKFCREMGRNPTDVELFQIGNGNSEHSRHWFFRGTQVIDGVPMEKSLMDLVKGTMKNNSNSLVAFHDNAGVIRGVPVRMLVPELPGWPSRFVEVEVLMHITSTAETHNHPTLIAPYPGAATGAGGRIRDSRAVGRGGTQHVGFAGYAVGALGETIGIPGEVVMGGESRGKASPLKILIEGSNGVSRYGNEIGEPLIGGFCRSFSQVVDGVPRAYIKPVLYSAGLGRILDPHVKKHPPEKGMLLVRIGGPAYRIGVGGGSASSMIHGSQSEELDLKSVQRGDAEMENRVNRVIQTCVELFADNPIESIHDQGAGGPSNVLTELMEGAGGTVDIRKITLGDPTMSVLEIWVAEYQEGYGLLVRPERIDIFRDICAREGVNCEVLGEITGDGRVVVEDSANGTTPVDLLLKSILGDLPKKEFPSNRKKTAHVPLEIPKGLTVEEALRTVFRVLGVGSKGYLVHKVDRSVGGLVARQQCCGPTQIPVADVGVTADGFSGLTGAAASIGEQPIKTLISSTAGARMTVAEMLTNMCSARISNLSDVVCRANWMWPAKLPGEGALLYDAAVAMCDMMLGLGIAIDGGKDSLSMAAQAGSGLVASPGTLVVKGYAPVPDITKVITPDFKGSSCLGLITFGGKKTRLGGSALAQALGQLGNESPDLDAEGISMLKRAFGAVQELIKEGLITAYHDISDGGLITAFVEMCLAGNRGGTLYVDDNDPLPWLFAEEAGMLFEYAPESLDAINRIMKDFGVAYEDVGDTNAGEGGFVDVRTLRNRVFHHPLGELREWWEETSNRLEREQSSKETADAEWKSHGVSRRLKYSLSFTPSAPMILTSRKPAVAVVREEGVNGDREMTAAFRVAGFDPMDIAMRDLLSGSVVSLDKFRGVIFPGGFSYADVFGSGKGWAAPFRFNPRVEKMFNRFLERKNTFSFGVCNGFQLMTNIGWLPDRGVDERSQPWLAHNESGRFESRWVGVRITSSPSIMLRGMEGSVLGVYVAHGEGKLVFPDKGVADHVMRGGLAPMHYVDPWGYRTETYPYNPNGSPMGFAALCSPDGRHLGMMPHPERTFLKWQWPWMPEQFRQLDASPWLQMFQNARTWVDEH